MENHQIRVTGVLCENNRLLLVQQKVDTNRGWSLPGGRLEQGETLQEALVRELLEETGLQVSVKRLLYVADIPNNNVVHITFEIQRNGGEIRLPTNEFDSNPISDVRFVELDELQEYGFSEQWKSLVSSSFTDAPRYAGLKVNIGL